MARISANRTKTILEQLTSKREKKGDDRRATIRTVSERGKGIRCHAYVSASGLVSVEQDERQSTVTAVMLKDAEFTLLCV